VPIAMLAPFRALQKLRAILGTGFEGVNLN
jgi:hypothetical protein